MKFADNFSVIQHRWPNLSEVLESVSAAPVSVSTQGPEATLVAQGIHLSSCYDALAEASTQAQLIPRDATEAWIYGMAKGELPRLLLQRNTISRVNVVIMNVALFKSVLSHVDCSDWLADGRVNVMLVEPDLQVRSPFCVSPACLKLADERSARLRDHLVLALESAYINARFHDNNLANQQIEDNEAIVAQDAGVASVFNSCRDMDAVVLAAGPTLSDYIELIKAYQAQGKCVVAVDAALKVMLAENIIPDFVISIDEHPEGVKSLFAADLSACATVPLIYFPVVHREVLMAWPGPRYVAYSASPMYEALRKRHPDKGVLFTSGSVFHSAVDFAVQLGCPRIHFFGADFCFPNGQTHAAGAAYSQSAGEATLGDWVLNGDGERVATLKNLRGYLRDLESYIEKHPDIIFINKSTQGAKINGTVIGCE